MPVFHPPVRDMIFTLEEVAGLAEIAALPGFADATSDLVTAVLAEAGRFGAEILAPLNPVGDREGCRLENGGVRTPTGFAGAYRRFVEGGWNGVAFESRYGGQDLPWVVASAVQEIWHGANMAFALTPMLTQSAVETLARHGDERQKTLFLPKLVSGEWTGTMNLTEPQAGSDLGALTTRAAWDGRIWRITGLKIFISAGDHDLAENIVHLVLARTPGAPEGIKGISLFVVPKFQVGDDGALGERNDVACTRLEHKLGLHGSPTCVMAYGERGGAAATLVGAEHQGLAQMFTMMNNARLSVGLEGVGQAERAYQKARAFASERIQGHAPGASGRVAIIHHADVRRMLMTAKALVEASRGLAYFVAGRVDVARRHPDPERRAHAQELVDLLTPVVKAWGSEVGIQVADLAIQVFGGMGYIEETGIAQHLRDARVAAIYEGTNGIQAMDLVNRKVIRDQGRAIAGFVDMMSETATALLRHQHPVLARFGHHLSQAAARVGAAARHLSAGHSADPHLAGATAHPFLELVGIAAGGWTLAKAASAAHSREGAEAADFRDSKIATAGFYADAIMPKTLALLAQVEAGSTGVMALAEHQF